MSWLIEHYRRWRRTYLADLLTLQRRSAEHRRIQWQLVAIRKNPR